MRCCSICGSENMPEEAAILFVGVGGSKREICDECAKNMDMLSHRDNAEEMKSAAAYFARYIWGDGYAADDYCIVDFITGVIMNKDNVAEISETKSEPNGDESYCEQDYGTGGDDNGDENGDADDTETENGDADDYEAENGDADAETENGDDSTVSSTSDDINALGDAMSQKRKSSPPLYLLLLIPMISGIILAVLSYIYEMFLAFYFCATVILILLISLIVGSFRK